MTLFKLGLGAITIYFIYQKIDLKIVGNYMGSANWLFLGLAFLTFFVSKIFAAFRLNNYYRSQKFDFSEILNLKLNFLSMFYGLFIPLIGGEGYRIYWIKKRFTVSTKSLIWSSLLDRGSGLVALLAIAIIIFQFSNIPFPFKLLLLLAVPLGYLIYHYFHHWLFKSYHSAWWQVNGHSLIVQLLQVLTTYFVLMALHVDDHLVDYIFVFLISSIAYVLPFLGARELVFVLGAEALGLNSDLSLAVSLYFYLALATTSLCGIYFLFFPKHLHEEA